MAKILTPIGTRTEVIKLAPVIRRFEEFPEALETINVSSSQHTHLLRPCAYELITPYCLEPAFMRENLAILKRFADSGNPCTLAAMLEEIRQSDSWIERLKWMENPFVRRDSDTRIVAVIAGLLGVQHVNDAPTPGARKRGG